jgi:hypothetical protein
VVADSTAQSDRADDDSAPENEALDSELTDDDSTAEGDASDSATSARSDVTGVASVDAAIDELAGLDALPTSEHVAVYEGLHRQLQDALADLDGA